MCSPHCRGFGSSVALDTCTGILSYIDCFVWVCFRWVFPISWCAACYVCRVNDFIAMCRNWSGRCPACSPALRGTMRCCSTSTTASAWTRPPTPCSPSKPRPESTRTSWCAHAPRIIPFDIAESAAIEPAIFQRNVGLSAHGGRDVCGGSEDGGCVTCRRCWA